MGEQDQPNAGCRRTGYSWCFVIVTLVSALGTHVAGAGGSGERGGSSVLCPLYSWGWEGGEGGRSSVLCSPV